MEGWKSPDKLVLEVFIGELVFRVSEWEFYTGDWVFVLDFDAVNLDQLLILDLQLDLNGLVWPFLEGKLVVLLLYVERLLFFEQVAGFVLDDVFITFEGDLIVKGFCDGEDQVIEFKWKCCLWFSLSEEVRRYLWDLGD